MPFVQVQISSFSRLRAVDCAAYRGTDILTSTADALEETTVSELVVIRRGRSEATLCAERQERLDRFDVRLAFDPFDERSDLKIFLLCLEGLQVSRECQD